MSQITVDIYDGANPSAHLGTLTLSRERQWLDQLNDTGSHSFKIHDLDLSSMTLLAYGNIARYSIGSDLFAGIIETRSFPPAPTDEFAGLVWDVQGRGVLALLEDAIVYPEILSGEADFQGSITGSTLRQRRFDFTATQYDDSNWIDATQIQQQGSGSPEPSWTNNPEGWPNPNAFWIWSRDRDSGGDMPEGTSYFRRVFNVDPSFNGFQAVFYATCDNEYQLFLDGEQILEGSDWKEMQSTTRILGQGLHTLAAVCTNGPLPEGIPESDRNPAGLLVAAYLVNPDGSIAEGLVTTEGSWKALDYPSVVPGMTLGQILRILLEEAQTRGALEGLSWTFTDSQDSNGASWTAGDLFEGIYTLNIVLDIGTNYLDVVRTMVEQWVDVRMSPTLVFGVFNKGDLGTDLSGSVSLVVGTDFESLGEAGEVHLTNSVLARDTTGLLTIQEDSGSLSSRKRREVYLEIALAPEETRAQQMSAEVLAEFSGPALAVTGTVTEESGPYSIWGPGDTISIPDPQGTATDATVISIAVSEDEVGHPIYVLEAVMFDASP